MMHNSFHFVRDEDRQTYRKGVRALALTYGAIIKKASAPPARHRSQAMMRNSFHLVRDEDRQTYRKGVRAIALIYGAIIILAIGATSMRVSAGSHEDSARLGPITMADLNKFAH